MTSIMGTRLVHIPPPRSPIRCADDRRALFNRIAPVYDNLNDLLSLGQHRVWKRMAVSWSGAKKGDCVLDLCCGSGDLAFLISQKVGTPGKVIGLDFSRDQLSVASSRQQSSSSLYRNIEWIEGDALDLPFSDENFDAVTIGYGLRNVLDRDLAIKEILRVLKPGSKLSVLDFNKSTQPFASMIQELMIDNVVVPTAEGFGLAQEYQYLKASIKGYLTGLFLCTDEWHSSRKSYSLAGLTRIATYDLMSGIHFVGEELEELALRNGFSSATFYEIAGGIMGNLVATR